MTDYNLQKGIATVVEYTAAVAGIVSAIQGDYDTAGISFAVAAGSSLVVDHAKEQIERALPNPTRTRIEYVGNETLEDLLPLPPSRD